jgi:phage portal protein BeeE
VISRIHSIADSVARAFAVTQNYPRVGLMPDLAEWMMGNPLGMTDEQFQHSDAFKKIPIIHAIVRLIQNDCAGLPRRFYDGEREIEPKFGNIAGIFNAANDRDTGHQFRLKLFGDLELYGNAYIYLERGRGAKPSKPPYAMWTLHPPSVKIVPGPSRTVSEYVWYGAGSPESMAPWSVIHIAKYNPTDSPLGVTWVEAAREDWMAQWYALKVLRAFFQRGGMSPGTWTTKKDARPLDDAVVKKLQARYGTRFQTIESIWKLIIMDGLEQVEKGQTIAELKLNEMIMLGNANLCRAAGVPPWMMGIKESGSLDQGKSSETSSESYWRSTIGNPCLLVDSVLNERFCPLFGEGIRIETEFEGVPALQAARLEMMKGAVIATGGVAVVSVDEAREWWDDDPTGREEDQLPPQKAAPVAPAVAAPGTEPQPMPRVAQRIKAATLRQRAERLRRRQEQRMAREERRFAALWNRVRDEQEEKALANLDRQERGEMAERINVDPDRLYPDITPEQRRAFEREIAETMARAASDAAEEIGADALLEVVAASVQKYIEKRVEIMIMHVSTTDRVRLREQIGAAVREGKQWREIQTLVRDFFEGRRANSMTIARTEVSGPYNRAQYETWRLGGVTRKFWLTMQDDAVRDSHVHAGERYSEEKSIGIDEQFQVGSGFCMVPGETGLAEEDINCRCQVLPDLGAFEEGIQAIRKPSWVNRVFRVNDDGFRVNGNGKQRERVSV